MSTSDDEFVILPNDVGAPMPQPPDVQEKIRLWLDPTEYDDGTSEYIKHLKSHLGGTGDWIEQTPEYQSWQSEEGSNVLWMKAIAGAGKSVIAARSRARIARHEDVPVLHFFFRHIITTNRTPKQLVRDWLAQLLPLSPHLQHQLKLDIIDERRDLEAVNFETLWALLRQAVSRMTRVYCFADALDEMSLGNEDFLAQVVQLGDIATCKVFITSRPVPHIVSALRNVTTPPTQIVLGAANMSEDISRYVDHRLDHDIGRYIDHRLSASGIRFPQLDQASPTMLLVRETLKSKAQGSFLYARLMTDNLLNLISERGGSINKEILNEILEALPTGLSAMYAGMVDDHAKRTGTPWSLQLSILQWVTHSERPLRLLELSAVLDFQKGSLQRNKDAKAIVRTACGPLLEILPSDVVGPIHHSFTEYLIDESHGQPIIVSSEAHQKMAEQCIKYLIEVLDLTSDHDDSSEAREMQDLKLTYPFLEYALTHWYKHIHKCATVNTNLLRLLDRLWLRGPCPGVSWLVAALGHDKSITWCSDISGARNAHLAESEKDNRDESEEEEGLWTRNGDRRKKKKHSLGPLHVAALAGLPQYIEHLISMGYHVEGCERSDGTSLYYAAEAGWSNAVAVLIKAGADVRRENAIGLTPLHAAARRNHVAIVETLLEAGVDPWISKTREHLIRRCGNGSRSVGDTPLLYACREGHLDTLHAFIPYLDASGLARALEHAIGSDKKQLMLALIQSEQFDATSTNNFLHDVSAQGDIVCMQALLKRGANASYESSPIIYNKRPRNTGLGSQDRGLPIHAFAQGKGANELSIEDTKRGLQVLIQAGNQINSRNDQSRTPLFLARASLNMAQALLELGADIATAMDEGTTPLHTVAQKRASPEAARFWIERGINVNSRRNSDGKTALMLIFENHSFNTELRELLLEAGADPNIKDHCGMTALHKSVHGHNPEQDDNVRALIRAGADLNARTNKGETVLHCIIDRTVSKPINVLMDAGVQLEARNSRGETALMKACQQRGNARSGWLSTLIAAGCRTDACDLDGRSCVHHFWTCADADLTSLDALITAGTDPRCVDASGNNAWHFLAMEGGKHVNFLDKLDSQGVAHNLPDIYGQTPFFWAVAFDNIAMVNLLASRYPEIHLNASDHRGRSPVHIAATKSDRMLMRLIELGADPRACTNRGSTILHFAAQSRQANVLVLVLQMIPSPLCDLVDAKDVSGMTALDYAARTGMPETVDLLIQHGAGFETPNLTRALHFCTENRAEELRWAHELQGHDQTFATRSASVQDSIRKGHDDELSRGLMVDAALKKSHYNNKKIHSDIRHCVRSLLNALDKVEAIFMPLPKLPGNNQRYGPVQQSAFRDAVEKDCEAVIEEVTIALAKTNTPVFTREISTLQFNFHRTLRLKSIEDKAACFRAALGDIKQVESRETLIHDCVKDGQLHVIDLYDTEMDVWNCTHDHTKTMLFDLVNEGSYEALERLASRCNFRDRSCPLSDYKDRSWFRQTTAFEFFKFEEVSAWDVLLAHACSRVLPNLPVIKVLLQHYPVTSLGRVVAVFKLVTSEAAWAVEALEYLLSSGVDPNSRNSKGRTPLHAACEVKSLYVERTIQCLLDHGADPNALDDGGDSCLVPDLNILRHLLAHGADFTNSRPPLLNKAIRAQQTDVVKLLIERGAELNSRFSDDEISKELDEHKGKIKPRGFSIEQHNLDYSFPLHLTACMAVVNSRHDPNAESRRHEILELLLQGGADPNLITHTGAPIVHETLCNIPHGGTDSISSLIRHPSLDLSKRDPDGNTVLLALANGLSSRSRRGHGRPGDLGLFDELVSRGLDITSTNKKGQNVLHLLLESLQYILWSPEHREFLHACQERALMNASDNHGVRPILFCLGSKNWKGVEILIELGADIASPDKQGNTAFHHLAKSLYHLDIKETLLFASVLAPRRSLDKSVASPTKEATVKNAKEKFNHLDKLFKSFNIDINACNKAGDPPLFDFLRTCPLTYRMYERDSDWDHAEKFLHRMQLFIDAGADFRGRAPNGQGALHILASLVDKRGQTFSSEKADARPLLAAWKKLVADGLDPYMEDDEQRTAIDVAAISGNAVILELY